MAKENKDAAAMQAPFFVPVVFDPASGIPMIPLYPKPELDSHQHGGIFAVPMLPFHGSPNLPPIPFTPLGVSLDAEGTSETSDGAGGAVQADNNAEQRRVVVRRFRVGIQLDLLLIVKLVTMVFIFSQDGSRDRFLLLFVAMIVYLYQTGALAPILRWASDRARRAMMPPPPAQAPNVAPVQREEDPNVAPTDVPREDAPGDIPQDAGSEVQVPPAAPAEEQQQHGRGLLRELQMIVVGFVTSLLPGFHNVD